MPVVLLHSSAPEGYRGRTIGADTPAASGSMCSWRQSGSRQGGHNRLQLRWSLFKEDSKEVKWVSESWVVAGEGRTVRQKKELNQRHWVKLKHW